MSAPEVIRAPGIKILAMSAAGFGVVVPPTPSTAGQLFAAHPEIVAAIDGPMFSICPGQPNDYAAYQCGRVNFTLLDRGRGVVQDAKPANLGHGVTFSLVGSTLLAARGAGAAPGATVAVQTYPGLVEDGQIAVGQPASGPNTETTGRIAMGVLRDGRMFFAYGRVPMHQFAVSLRDAGAAWAGYTDGGGSSSLVQRMADGSLAGSDADDPHGRRVPSWIVWSPGAGGGAGTGGRSGGLTQQTSYAVPVLILAGAVTAAILVARSRRRR